MGKKNTAPVQRGTRIINKHSKRRIPKHFGGRVRCFAKQVVLFCPAIGFKGHCRAAVVRETPLSWLLPSFSAFTAVVFAALRKNRTRSSDGRRESIAVVARYQTIRRTPPLKPMGQREIPGLGMADKRKVPGTDLAFFRSG